MTKSNNTNGKTLNKLRIDKNIFKLIKEIHTQKNQQLTLHWGFPGGSDGKESTCNVGGLGSIPGLGRSPGEGKGSPLRYPGLENPMDCAVHGVAESDTTE